MALTTYQDIQDTLKKYLWDRTDVSGLVPDFIVMAESRMNSTLRLSAMEASTSITLTSGSGSLPSDYLAWRSVNDQGNPVRALEWAEPDWAEDHFIAQTAATLSSHFTIVGNTLRTFAPSSTNVTLKYYQKIPALASNTTGNWVTSRAPLLYIYAAMLEASVLLADDERAPLFGAMYKDQAEILIRQDTQAKFAKSAPRIKGRTP